MSENKELPDFIAMRSYAGETQPVLVRLYLVSDGLGRLWHYETAMRLRITGRTTLAACNTPKHAEDSGVAFHAQPGHHRIPIDEYIRAITTKTLPFWKKGAH